MRIKVSKKFDKSKHILHAVYFFPKIFIFVFQKKNDKLVISSKISSLQKSQMKIMKFKFCTEFLLVDNNKL